MKVLVWTIFCMEALAGLITFAEIMANKYPKATTRSVRGAVVALLVQIGFLVWASILLFGKP